MTATEKARFTLTSKLGLAQKFLEVLTFCLEAAMIKTVPGSRPQLHAVLKRSVIRNNTILSFHCKAKTNNVMEKSWRQDDHKHVAARAN